MTTREDVLINVQGSIKDYLQELKRIPGVTGKVITDANKKIEDETKKSAKKTADAWDSAFDSMEAGFGRVAKAAPAALAAAFVGGTVALGTYTSELMAARTETILFSESTGVALDTITAVEAAADRAGRPIDDIRDSFMDFGETLFDFSQGGGRAKEAFELLGIEGDNVMETYGGVDGALREVLRSLPKVEDEVKRNAIAQQILGDTGVDLIGILGDIPLEEFEQLAGDTGRAIDEEAVQQTEKWNTSLAVLQGELRRSSTELVDFLALGTGLELFTRGFLGIENAAKQALAEVLDLGDVSSALFSLDAVAFADAVDAAFARVGGSAVQASQDFTEEAERLADVEEAGADAKIELEDLASVQEDAAKAVRVLAKEERELEKAQRDAARAALAEAKALQAKRDSIDDAIESLRALNASLLSGRDGELQAIEETRLARLAALDEIATVQEITDEELSDARIAIVEAFLMERADLTDQFRQEDLDKQKEVDEGKKEGLLGLLGAIQEASEQTFAIFNDVNQIFLSNIQDAATESANAVQKQLDQRKRVTDDALKSIDKLKAARDSLQDKLDEGVSLEEQRAIAAEDRELQMQIRIEEADLKSQQKRLDGRRKVAEDILADEQKRATKLFNIQRAAAISQAIIQGAVATVRALAELGPIAGPIAAGFIGGTVLTQIGVIGSEEPPKFHAGSPSFTGGPDEFTATLRRGEQVTDQRAAENSESSRESQRRGGDMSGFRLQIGTREIGRVVRDEMRRGRELTGATSGRRPGIRPTYITR
ncbi:MAG: hypothetical protein HRU00_12305 [Myxococcales bacterium]|nr:hypothetical protein [Myxococcales bacterium]